MIFIGTHSASPKGCHPERRSPQATAVEGSAVAFGIPKTRYFGIGDNTSANPNFGV
jgi:hypothetical protein